MRTFHSCLAGAALEELQVAMGTVELEVGEADHEAREGVPALHLHHALPPRAPVVVQRDLDIQCTVKSVLGSHTREAQKVAA